MNISSKTNNYAVKLNRIFFPNNYFLSLFAKAIRVIGNIIAASEAIRDIGNIIAASDRPN